MSAEILRQEALSYTVGKDQRCASAPGQSVWVSASAGSGKTKVLADRVTRLLLDGVRPERILCLTFTRAAAAEMSIRLSQRLSRWATCDEAALDKELYDLQDAPVERGQREAARRLFAQVLACPGGLRLQTIHAFAQEILKRFPLEAGLAPHFAVMEEAEANALWREAFDELLEEIAEKKKPEAAAAFAGLVRKLGEDTLITLLREMRGQEVRLKKAARGGLAKLQAHIRTALDLSPQDSEAQFRLDGAREDAFDRAALLSAARLLAEKASPMFKERGEIILRWLEKDERQRAQDFDAYTRAFISGEGEAYAKVASKDLLQERPEIEDVLKTETTRVLSVLERIETVGFAEQTENLLTLSLEMARAYAAKKAAHAALDYDDLIAKTNDVLVKPDIAPWVLFKLDGGIDHILVDESQDTSPAQWQIIKALAEDYFSGESAWDDRIRTLFVVGDEKQSIYSFLKADPEEFARMRAFFAVRITQAEKPYQEVPLNVSFRSAPAILRAVDAVFANDKVRSGVSHEAVVHKAFRAEAAGRVEVWPLFVPPKEEGEKKKSRVSAPEDWQLPLECEEVHDPVAELATSLAAQIKMWVEDGYTIYDRDLKAQRPMTAGDVMVLVQRRRPFVDPFVRALKRCGVPVTGVDRMRLTDQLAVMDLTALLQFALLPQDDLTLACVLRGPLIGASEEDMMHLAIGRKGSLWQSLESQAAQPYTIWRDYLAKVAAMADQIAPLAMLSRLLSEPCPADACSGRRAIAARLGPDAEDPIDELLSAAEEFGHRHSPSLQAFLHWLITAETEVKREMEQAEGRVRITTVHTSKGLEAPIVILPDTVTVPDRQKLSKILWDEAAGLPFYIPREPRHAKLRALRTAAYDKQLQEYRRLLYVALTRAADRLYIAGFVKKDADASKENWYNMIAQGLKDHHRPEVEVDSAAPLQPQIVMADYAGLPKTTTRPARESGHPVSLSSTQNQPAWLFAPPPPEPSPPRPLVPSRPEQEEPPTISPKDARFARGRIIHRLLQSLPDMDVGKREEAALRFLASPQHDLTKEAQIEIANEVLALLNDPRFASLFGLQSRAELPLVGLSGERLIAGQVDRLALVGDEVWIVDYKTNRPPPVDAAHIPQIYHDQMEAYRTVLRAVYPDMKIRCFLLWTYTLRLMEVGGLGVP